MYVHTNRQTPTCTHSRHITRINKHAPVCSLSCLWAFPSRHSRIWASTTWPPCGWMIVELRCVHVFKGFYSSLVGRPVGDCGGSRSFVSCADDPRNTHTHHQTHAQSKNKTKNRTHLLAAGGCRGDVPRREAQHAHACVVLDVCVYIGILVCVDGAETPCLCWCLSIQSTLEHTRIHSNPTDNTAHTKTNAPFSCPSSVSTHSPAPTSHACTHRGRGIHNGWSKQ